MGGHRPIVWGGKLIEKICNTKYTTALDGLWLMILNATTNKIQVAVMERSTEGRCNEAQGKQNSIVLGALDIE